MYFLRKLALQALAVCALWCLSLPSSTAQTTTLPEQTGVKFELTVVAPAKISDFLLLHMELQRFKELGDLDALELSRLVLRIPDDVQELLGTQGYFSPTIETRQSTRLAGTSTNTITVVTVVVTTGPLTQIDSVKLDMQGDIATNPVAQDQALAIRKTWQLGSGEPFTQNAWDSAKAAALRDLTAKRYPLGRIVDSRADVTPEDQSAKLALTLDSGPLMVWVAPRAEGIERYETATVENLARLSGLREGEEYSLSQLQDAQQRIADSGYFDSVFVYAQPQAGQTMEPIIQVRETKLQKIVLGIGASAENGLRLNAQHTHHRLPWIGWRAQSTLNLERDDQSLGSDWTSTPDTQGWRTTTGALYKRQIDGLNTTVSQRLRFGYTQENLQQDRSYFLQYDRARTTGPLDNAAFGTGLESSLTANLGWTRRRFDNLRAPQAGYGIAVELGAGITLGQKREPFTRIFTRGQYFLPLDNMTRSNKTTPDVQATRYGRLVFRAEAGVVTAKKGTPVPDTQLFLTGGDNTVRGYKLREIGVPLAAGGVSAGSHLAVVSAEWQRPLTINARPSPLQSVVFVDGGAVANSAAGLKLNWGIGTGLLYNSPAGPLQASVAYGLGDKKLRLHLNVGFSF
jgi:translocation and assembly module TamA